MIGRPVMIIARSIPPPLLSELYAFWEMPYYPVVRLPSVGMAEGFSRPGGHQHPVANLTAASGIPTMQS